MRFGDKIKVLLDRRGMTQRELAKRIGITEVSMSRYINNSRVPKGPLVAAMAKALGVSADELLGLAEGPVISNDKSPLVQPERTENTRETHACDCISRQAAIEALHMHLMYRMGTDSNKKQLDEWINNLPSAQPEIIRCKDCRNNHWCNIQEAAMAGDNFFCGAAERRTDEQ